MKTIILLCVLFCITKIVTAQSIEYTYDNSGNRIKRELVTATISSESVAIDSLDESPIEDYWEDREIKLYPNPTKGNLIVGIYGGDEDDLYSYKIFNSNGKILKSKENFSIGEYTLDLESYSAGLYFLVLQCDGSKKTYKIIKE